MPKNYRFHLSMACAFACLLVTTSLSAQTTDPAFVPPFVFRHAQTFAIKKAWKDKTYIAGDFDFHGQTSIGQIVRLTPGGYLDTSFKPQLPDEPVRDIEILPNGNILVLLEGHVTGGNSVYVLAVDGRLIGSTPWDHIVSMEPLPDNGFMVATPYYIFRFNKNAAQHDAFLIRTADEIKDIELQGSKILVSGTFDYVIDPVLNSSADRVHIARFNLDGTFDPSFNANSTAEGYGGIFGMTVQPDGKIILGNKYNTTPSKKGAIRLNADGSLDTSFNSPALSTSTVLEASVDGDKITISTPTSIVRLNLNGSADASFQPITFEPALVRFAVLSDMSMVVANYSNSTYRIDKFTPGGINTNSYNAAITRNGIINSMDRTSTSIYIAGDFFKVNNHFTSNVARLNPNGSVLTKFKVTSNPGVVNQIEAFSNAKSLISTPNGLIRLEHDGRNDPSFSYSPIDGVSSISKFIVQDDGKILIGAPSKIHRLNNNGSRDTGFNAAVGIVSNGYYFDFDLDRPTGKIIFTALYGTPLTFRLQRLFPDGSVDPGFNSQLNFVSESGGAMEVIFLDNLEVLLASTQSYFTDKPNHLLKLTASGAVDQEFLSNYEHYHTGVSYYEEMHRFNDRIIVGTNYFYSDSFLGQAIFDNGFTDNAFSYGDITPRYVNEFYSDNNQELFIVGDIKPSNSARRFQIVKLLYPAADATTARVEADISFYPNPARDFLTVKLSEKATVRIFKFTGESALTVDVSSSEQRIDLNNLSPGRYVLQFDLGGRTYKNHFVKE